IPENLVPVKEKAEAARGAITNITFASNSTSSPLSQKETKGQVKAEILSILTDVADLCNAIHWLPPGFLWAGRFPPWLVGLLGTISSLIGIYQASRGENSEAV
ncbi:PREDICTED: peroxisomal membrane protein 11C, partial [Apaloderma vittatum]|uniref:peroxisomal membrane protein 11C n=1 Tax=Apaloderma vittatum TaxID=57397 RepID=UPI000521C12E